MSNLEQFYTEVGSSAATIISRLGGSEALVLRFLAKLPSDPSFELLRDTLEKGDTDTAFRAAHTLKGVCANLGVETLFQKA